MLDMDTFNDRATALWDSQKRMAAARTWKSGRRAGAIRRAASAVEFTKQELRGWLLEKVGLSAIRCRYCRQAIDIVSLTLDHITPRALGGRFTLANLDCQCCQDCNGRKSNMTSFGFLNLLEFAQNRLVPHDYDVLMKRLLEANAGSSARFWRNKATQQKALTPPPPVPQSAPAKQKPMDFDPF
jgi:hypothetical protein